MSTPARRSARRSSRTSRSRTRTPRRRLAWADRLCADSAMVRPASACTGMPIGATSTRPASTRPSWSAGPPWGGGRSPSGRRGRSAPTARPDARSSAVGVSTARTGTPWRRAARHTSTAALIGSRSGPLTPVPSSASTTSAARSRPWSSSATSCADAACIRSTLARPSSASQFAAASGGAGPLVDRDEHDERADAVAGQVTRRQRSRRRRCCRGRTGTGPCRRTAGRPS